MCWITHVREYKCNGEISNICYGTADADKACCFGEAGTDGDSLAETGDGTLVDGEPGGCVPGGDCAVGGCVPGGDCAVGGCVRGGDCAVGGCVLGDCSTSADSGRTVTPIAAAQLMIPCRQHPLVCALPLYANCLHTHAPQW